LDDAHRPVLGLDEGKEDRLAFSYHQAFLYFGDERQL
jgi:hypothetical protein